MIPIKIFANSDYFGNPSLIGMLVARKKMMKALYQRVKILHALPQCLQSHLKHYFHYAVVQKNASPFFLLYCNMYNFIYV